jgi:hypothetical protein
MYNYERLITSREFYRTGAWPDIHLQRLRKNTVRIIGFPAGTPTEHLPKTNQRNCRFNQFPRWTQRDQTFSFNTARTNLATGLCSRLAPSSTMPYSPRGLKQLLNCWAHLGHQQLGNYITPLVRKWTEQAHLVYYTPIICEKTGFLNHNFAVRNFKFEQQLNINLNWGHDVVCLATAHAIRGNTSLKCVFVSAHVEEHATDVT